MALYCEIAVKKYFPAIRKILSIKLTERGYSQNEISELLGITQAAVSQYLKNYRGKELDIDIEEEIEKVIRILTTSKDIKKRKLYMCYLCTIIREKASYKDSVFCNFKKELFLKGGE